jgi:opacity protein-like surface antigen
MQALRVAPLLLVLLVTRALAEDELPPERGVEVGLRTGLALPFGKIDAHSDDISTVVSLQIPIWLDLGYRVTPEITVGAYAQLGFIVNTNACQGCTARDWRFGATARYHFQPKEPVHPWVGFGAGYEIFTRDFAVPGGQSGSATNRGWEFANFQAGVDKRYSRNATLGAFISFSFGEITAESAKIAGTSTDVPDFEKSVHEWLLFGVRGCLDL